MDGALEIQRHLVNRENVGRIAERIVANELEARGFRVSDLNRDGLSANADLLAVGHGKAWQVQVKGATNMPAERWWIGYGYATQSMISGTERVFNRREGPTTYYTADIVVLVAVRSPRDYRCFVMPTEKAEAAAQINLERDYKREKRKGGIKKPGKLAITLEPPSRFFQQPADKLKLLEKEREMLKQFEDAWDVLG